MVPETWLPTRTVSRAFSVPSASTDRTMVPMVTGSVRMPGSVPLQLWAVCTESMSSAATNPPASA